MEKFPQNPRNGFVSCTAIILDVDGVLTDGSLLVTDDGAQLRTMGIRDGYALQLAVKCGIRIVVISGGKSEGVQKRLAGLGVTEVVMQAEDKQQVLRTWSALHSLDLSRCIYIGDDLPDFEAMQLCGMRCCPADAAPEIVAISDYVSPLGGGKGCVRDILEKVLKLRHQWPGMNGVRTTQPDPAP